MIEFTVIIKAEAEFDLIFIVDYYESQKDGLGIQFVNSFEAGIQKVRQNPDHTLKVTNEFRRVVIPRFPYSVYYLVAENSIIVFAVLHQSRKPDKILKRFE